MDLEMIINSLPPVEGWETSARPLANASENMAGRV